MWVWIIQVDKWIGTLVSKAKKLETNSYRIEGFFYEIAAQVWISMFTLCLGGYWYDKSKHWAFTRKEAQTWC